jgi:hypothetical protein
MNTVSHTTDQVWWCTSASSVLGRLTQEDLKFEAEILPQKKKK